MSEPITIIGVEVRNFRRITFAHVRLDKRTGLVRVTGKNRAGKTSLLHAISAALGGARAIEGDQTVHDGAQPGDESFTQLLLSNGFTITRRFTPATPKGALTIVGDDGGRYGQAKLDEWLGERSFDPLAFYDLDEKRRAKVLLSLGQDPGLAARLDEIRGQRRDAYDRRTPHIVGLRAAKAVRRPEGERPEAVNVQDEVRRLQQYRQEQSLIERAERETGRCAQQVEEAAIRVKAIQAQLEAAREALLTAQANLDEANEALGALPPDRKETIAGIEAHIATANEANAALEPWKIWERAQLEAGGHEAEIEALSAAIRAFEDAEIRELENAALPVSGLTFDAEGNALINGQPFAVASGAEKIKLAVEVAIAANPRLRICLLDEANDLDLDSLVELDRLAREKGFSIWAVRIGIEGPGEVQIEDGHTV